jgi:hypothetical protein
MASKTQKTAPVATPVAQAAAVATPGARRVFGPDQCHQRGDDGNPVCNNPKQPGRNLCRDHEKVWQAAAKLRRAERQAGNATTTPLTPNTKVSNAKSATPVAPVAGNGESRKPKAPHPMKVLSVPVARTTQTEAQTAVSAAAE